MTTERDDASMRRYREASVALDERPSAATRAAILAAAARQVEARPQSADTPRTVRRPRWPLAAAAAVLLSSLAVLMATRTEQEMPSFTAPAERAPESVAVAPPPAPSTVPSATADRAAAVPPSTQAPAPSAATQKSTARERSLATPSGQADARQSEAANAGLSAPSAQRAPEAASAESPQAFPATPPAAAPPPAAPYARSPPAPVAGPLRAPDSGAGAKPERPSADAGATREGGPAAKGSARLDTAREFEGSAPAWLERIVRLRGEGRDAEADGELKRFRERYPEAQVPPAALPRGTASGTR